MLIWLILTPIIASALIGLCKAPARATALISASITLLLGIWAVVDFDTNAACWQEAFGQTLQFTLAPPMSKVMLILTILVTFATVLGTNAPDKAKASWFNSALLISAGATGAFLSDNIISFFAFHELALIPTFVMIGAYGRGDKRSIAWRATVYLGAASMILLTGLIAIGSQLGYTFTEMKAAVEAGATIAHPEIIAGFLIIGFGTLVSLFPFHSWAAPAYASAPTPVAMMHAGVLKKFGLFGLFMFQPILESGFKYWNTTLLVLLVCNVIWVGYVTVQQRRLDLLLGNSSVMHMGYIFLAFAALVSSGSAALNPWAVQGAALLMLAHGLSIALLFLLCGQIEEQTGTLEINSLGGLGGKLPRMAFVFGLAGMASIGLPGLANFAGEFLVFFSGFAGFNGGFGAVQIATILCLWGLVIGAVYMLRAYRNIFQGDLSNASSYATSISVYGVTAGYFLVACLIAFGFVPGLILQFFTR